MIITYFAYVLLAILGLTVVVGFAYAAFEILYGFVIYVIKRMRNDLNK